MTQEQEAQQAETINRYIVDSVGGGIMEHSLGDFVRYDAHKTIIDSQSQKIAQLTGCNESQATQIERLFRGKHKIYEVCKSNIKWQREQRKLQSQKIEAMQKQLNAYSLLTEAVGSLMQKQYTESEPLSGKEVSDLWEKLRYMGTNNSYLYFEALDRRGLLNPDAVRRFLGAIKEKEE